MNIITKYGRTLLLAAVVTLFSSLLLIGCSDDDYKKLDGDWDRGDIVITFSNGSATFTRINSNSGWENVRQNGSIRIGDKKFKDITGSNLKWTCQELTYNRDSYTIADWKEGTITMDEDGQTITVYTPGSATATTYYTKVGE